MTVTPAGLVVTNAYWNEGHREMGLYQNGQVTGILPCSFMTGTTQGGYAITNNGTYIYGTNYMGSGGAPITPGNSVKRWTIAGAVSPFSGGGGDCGNQIMVDSGTGLGKVFGLAASSSELYVSDSASNSVKIYDANTMAYKRAFRVTNPRRIAFDPSNNTLWVSTGGTGPHIWTGNVYHYDLKGNLLAGTITDAAAPAALLMHNDGDTWHLYVGDSGPDQQIKIYKNTGGAHVSTFGAQGGTLSGTPGVWAANKLHRPNGIGFDNSGNIYIVGGSENYPTDIGLGPGQAPDGLTYGNPRWDTDMRAFNSGGNLLWHLDAQEWIDGGTIDEDTDGLDVYTQWDHDKFDYGKLTTGVGGGGQEWSVYASNVDRYDYPWDIRGDTSYAFAIRTIGGIKYLAVGAQWGKYMELFHMIGEIAKPMLILEGFGNDPIPNKPGWSYYWYDTNNNGIPDAGEFAIPGMLNNSVVGFDFDTNGHIWFVGEGTAGLYRVPKTGQNAGGQLTYGSWISYGLPALFTSLERSQYIAATDTIYVTGFTAASPKSANEGNSLAGYSLGSVAARYNNFLAYWNANGTWPAPAWNTVLPYNVPPTGSQNGLAMRQMSVAGSKVFFSEPMTEGAPTQFSPSGHKVFLGPMTGNIWVYDAATGAYQGRMTPGVEANYLGWQDGNMVLQAYQRSNGEYVVTEEEQVSGHVTVLRGMLNNFTQY